MKRRPKLRLVEKDVAGGAASIFDDIDKLRAAYATADRTPGEAAANDDARPLRRPRARETFAQIPHDRALELYRRRIGRPAWVVLIELDRLILTQHQNPVRFWSPRLRAAGLSAGTRARALRQLEAAEVIKVKLGKKGKSPLVHHLWYSRQG